MHCLVPVRRGLMLFLFATCLTLPAAGAAQGDGSISGSLPSGGGFALVVWSGGSLQSLSATAAAEGCNLVAAWIASGGAFDGYIYGALDLVNAAFLVQVPGGQLGVQTPLILVCGGGTAPVGVTSGTPPASTSNLPALPSTWPRELQLGMSDPPGGAAMMAATAPFGFRYQYLSAGVNTGNGWATWNPDGSFVTNYVRESIQQSITPVFSYYQIRQSAPGATDHATDDSAADLENVQDVATMTAYYNDLKLFFQHAGAFTATSVVLHVEPDLWGYLEQESSDPTSARIMVAATGLADLAGLPDTAAGFAQAVVRLRDRYAPNVLLAYHLSVWGTGNDIAYSKPSDDQVRELASEAASYYQALGANFDLAFAEFSDRDAGFKQVIDYDNGASWWGPADFARNVLFLSTFVHDTGKRVVMWQIPYGNTKMLAENNTWDHFQDNRVEWLLDDPGFAHLGAYTEAGVIGFLFGRGADGATCACDAANDGVTNPAPINGNAGQSLNADDDGGFFRQQAAAYYASGPIALP